MHFTPVNGALYNKEEGIGELSRWDRTKRHQDLRFSTVCVMVWGTEHIFCGRCRMAYADERPGVPSVEQVAVLDPGSVLDACVRADR
jgi:hypothetical protein